MGKFRKKTILYLSTIRNENKLLQFNRFIHRYSQNIYQYNNILTCQRMNDSYRCKFLSLKFELSTTTTTRTRLKPDYQALHVGVPSPASVFLCTTPRPYHFLIHISKFLPPAYLTDKSMGAGLSSSPNKACWLLEEASKRARRSASSRSCSWKSDLMREAAGWAAAAKAISGDNR